jgi:predicted kinase
VPDPALVLVTGKPASGKTTLATRLAADLGFPLLTKDAIKESLYDTIGWSDKAHSQQLGAASFRVLFTVLDAVLAAGVSAVAEAPFDREISARELEKLRERRPFTLVQVLCHADGQVLIDRYRARNESGHRHPGHVLTDAMPDVEMALADGRHEPVAIESAVFEVDTTDPATIDYERLLQEIRHALPPG